MRRSDLPRALWLGLPLLVVLGVLLIWPLLTLALESLTLPEGGFGVER